MTSGRIEVRVHPDHEAEIAGNQQMQEALAACARSFLLFLDHWTFLDQERGKQRKLDSRQLWPGQTQLVEYMEARGWIYALKARKLGFTTLETAYDAWVARFRGPNERVHLFSRREDAAVELLDAVKYGLRRLPYWMQLPEGKSTTTELHLLTGKEDDARLVKAYPANETTSVEKSCTHGHVDEWARMLNPEGVWQAIEPTMAGSCHLITTGVGPANFTADYWRASLAGDNGHVAIFIDALEREGRDMRWLESKRRSMTEEQFRQEYPMKWEDALFGGGKFKFRAGDVTVAGMGQGATPPEAGHKYVKGWDIGRHEDAAVGVVIDVSLNPNEVVEYVRLRGAPYPVLQKEIEHIHKLYKGPTAIEKNNAGEAVAENLEGVAEHELILFNTSQKSKARIIEELQLSLEAQDLRWSKAAWPQLDNEVRGYQVPDDNLVQDSVIALCIANAHASAPPATGKIGSVMAW